MTHVDYVLDRPDGELASALNAACKQIRDEIARHGPIERNSLSQGTGVRRHIANPPDYKLNSSDLMFLGECAASHTEQPKGLSLFSISAQMGKNTSNTVRLSAIKMTRLGYIEKSIETDHDGDEFYSYSITEDGLDIYLQNEDAFKPTPPTFKPAPRPVPKPAPNFSDMDDDVPF